MANRGVHLIGTTHAQPSFFEIVSHESLASVLEPALKKILDFVASSNPEKYAWLVEWSDEIYTIFNGALQTFYLKNYSASFSETFYGLKRIPLNKQGSNLSLSKTQKILSFMFLVILPYISKKLDKLEEKYAIDCVPNQKWSPLDMRNIYLVKGNKLFRIINEALVMYHYVLYISGRSKYPTLTLRLLRATLTCSRVQQTITITQLFKKIGKGSFTIVDVYNLFKSLFIGSLEVGAFLVQFARWNQENYSKSFTALPKPPPPPISETATRYKGLCPICYKTYINPTTLVTSGYVFCYQCILREIHKYGKCPVTNYPGKEDDLVRLYTQS